MQVDCGMYVGTSSVDYMKLAIAQRNNQLQHAPSSIAKGGITPYSATGMFVHVVRCMLSGACCCFVHVCLNCIPAKSIRLFIAVPMLLFNLKAVNTLHCQYTAAKTKSDLSDLARSCTHHRLSLIYLTWPDHAHITD